MELINNEIIIKEYLYYSFNNIYLIDIWDLLSKIYSYDYSLANELMEKRYKNLNTPIFFYLPKYLIDKEITKILPYDFQLLLNTRQLDKLKKPTQVVVLEDVPHIISTYYKRRIEKGTILALNNIDNIMNNNQIIALGLLFHYKIALGYPIINPKTNIKYKIRNIINKIKYLIKR